MLYGVQRAANYLPPFFAPASVIVVGTSPELIWGVDWSPKRFVLTWGKGAKDAQVVRKMNAK